MAILLDAGAPAFAERVPSSSPAATSYTLALAADRRSAERNETIAYTIWLNVSGGGSLQLVSVNFTVEPDLILVETAITLPVACGTNSSNATFAAWQCSFLRSGDRKSTRLNSSHLVISYAVFCLNKKTAGS